MVSGGCDVFGAPAGGRFRPQDRSAGHEGRCLMTLPRVELGHCWGGRVPQLAGAFDAARPFGESFFGKMKRRDHIDMVLPVPCLLCRLWRWIASQVRRRFVGLKSNPIRVGYFQQANWGAK